MIKKILCPFLAVGENRVPIKTLKCLAAVYIVYEVYKATCRRLL